MRRDRRTDFRERSRRGINRIDANGVGAVIRNVNILAVGIDCDPGRRRAVRRKRGTRDLRQKSGRRIDRIGGDVVRRLIRDPCVLSRLGARDDDVSDRGLVDRARAVVDRTGLSRVGWLRRDGHGVDITVLYAGTERKRTVEGDAQVIGAVVL